MLSHDCSLLRTHLCVEEGLRQAEKGLCRNPDVFGGRAEIGLAYTQSKGGLCRRLGGLWECLLSLKELSCVWGRSWLRPS